MLREVKENCFSSGNTLLSTAIRNTVKSRQASQKTSLNDDKILFLLVVHKKRGSKFCFLFFCFQVPFSA